MVSNDGPKRRNLKSKLRTQQRAKRKSTSAAHSTGMDRRRNKHWSW